MRKPCFSEKRHKISKAYHSIFIACLIAFCLPVFIAPAHAKNPDVILGKWLSQQKNVGIEIYRHNGKYSGRIAWFKEPTYRLTDSKGMGGKTRIDRENPDTAKRNRPLLGINLIWDFVFSGNQLWENGFIYDPLYGNTYSGTISLEPPDTLKVRAYMLFTLFGKTEILNRVKEWPQSAESTVKAVKEGPFKPGASNGKPANKPIN